MQNENKAFCLTTFLYVFVLSLVLVFASMQRAKAIVGLLVQTAASWATAGAVYTLARMGAQGVGGYVVRQSTATGAIGAAARLAVAGCARVPQICSSLPNLAGGLSGTLAGKIVEDGWKTDVDNSDPNHPKIEIYKDNDSNSCRVSGFKFLSTDGTVEGFQQNFKAYAQRNAVINGRSVDDYKLGDVGNKWASDTEAYYKANGYAIIGDTKDAWVNVGSTFARYQDGEFPLSIAIKTTCATGEGSKTYMSDTQMYNYLIQYGNEGDLTNIYNNDYSKINNVNINNETFNGGDVDNSIHNTNGGNGYSLPISPTLAPNIKGMGDLTFNPKTDIRLPDVNETNCTKNSKGELAKCKNSQGNEVGDTASSATAPTSAPAKTDPSKDSSDPSPIECSANGFYQKVCDWMDWTQKDFEQPDNTQPDIIDKTKDLPALKRDRIKFQAQCPPAKKFSINVMGKEISKEISYQMYCDFFSAFKPYALGFSTLSAVMIIAGVGRKNG